MRRPFLGLPMSIGAAIFTLIAAPVVCALFVFMMVVMP